MRSLMRVLAAIGLTFAALAVFTPQLTVVGQSEAKDLVINYVAQPIPNQSEQSNEVRAYFSVLDADRQSVPGLTKDTVGVSIFGKPVTDFDLSTSQDPMSVILVIDTSSTMLGKPLDQAKEAAKQFVDGLSSGDEVGLFSFNLTVTNHMDGFSTDRNAVKNVLGSSQVAVPKVDAWTCLYDGMYEAVSLAVQRPQGRRAIIVLADGEDIGPGRKQCSKHNLGDVIEKAQGTKVPIYVIGLGNVDRALLERIASQTGGEAVISPKADDLSKSFQRISQLLKGQYLLKFDTTESGSGPLQINMKSSPNVVDDVQITLIKPAPLPLPPGPDIVVEDHPQIVEGSLVFTVSFQAGLSNAPIKDARWYVDNVQMGVITDVQQATHQLTYRMRDSASKCLVGHHELRIEAINEVKGESKYSVSFPIEENMCPTGPIIGPVDAGIPIWVVPVAAVALLALGGVFVVMRRQSKVRTVVMQENLSDKTEEAPAEVGLVARLRLMGGSQTADGKTEVSMTTETFRIGRGPDNDLQLEEKKVSRKHAEIHFNPVMRTFTLFDRNSTGGTRVNDKFVKASSEMLTNNATIVVGSANILFEVVRGGDLTGESTGSATEDDDRTEMERP